MRILLAVIMMCTRLFSNGQSLGWSLDRCYAILNADSRFIRVEREYNPDEDNYVIYCLEKDGEETVFQAFYFDVVKKECYLIAIRYPVWACPELARANDLKYTKVGTNKWKDRNGVCFDQSSGPDYCQILIHLDFSKK
jgi:hypothetical protein